MKKSIIALAVAMLTVPCLDALELSLEQCRQMAVETDQDITIARNRVQQANLDKGIATAAYLPKFDANGGAFYLTPDPSLGPTMDLQMRGVYMAGITLTQPIYTGGKIITANKLANVGREVARTQLEMTTQDVIAQAEKSYWMYVAVLAKIDMLNAYMTQLDTIYAYTRTACEVGLTTSLSVDRVESRRSELDYRMRQARSGADICRLAICRIIGVDDNEPIVPTQSIDDVAAPTASFAGIDQRPELTLAQKNIDAKKLDVRMALSDFLPTVGMQLGWSAMGNIKMTTYTPLPDGSLDPYTVNFGNHGFMGAISVSIPLFHWGEGYKTVKKARIEAENAGLAYEKNSKLIMLQARQAYNNYIDSYELIASANKALTEAQNNLDAITRQYQLGLMTLTDLLEAQAQWHTAYSNLIEARTQYKINQVDYLRATGQTR